MQATKKELTELFLKEANFPVTPETIKTYMHVWWMTPYSPIGLRLTSDGNKFLSSTLKLTKYTYTIKEDNVKSLRLYLRMNKHLTSPYYLQGADTIILYGETDACMMGMYGGDIATYLNNFTR